MGGKEGRVLEECYFCIHSQCLTTDRPSDCDHRNVDDKKVLLPPPPRPSVSIHGTLVSPAAFSVFLLKPVSALLTNNAMHDLYHLIRGYIDSLCYNLIFFSW